MLNLNKIMQKLIIIQLNVQIVLIMVKKIYNYAIINLYQETPLWFEIIFSFVN